MTHVRITFVRHGETDHNKAGMIQGNLDTSLNSEGLEQAKKVSKRFSTMEPKVNLIISSNLSRAKTTAETIHQHLQDHHNEKIPFLETDLLQERGMGIYQGKFFKDLKKPLNELNLEYDEFPQPRLHHCLNEIALNENTKVETLQQVNDRVFNSIQFVLESAMKQMSSNELEYSFKSPFHVVVVSHGLFLSGVVGNLIRSEKGKWMPAKFSNTGVSTFILEVEKNEEMIHRNPLLINLNDVTHHNF
jgi:broad specificity phosphatase PhoE